VGLAAETCNVSTSGWCRGLRRWPTKNRLRAELANLVECCRMRPARYKLDANHKKYPLDGIAGGLQEFSGRGGGFAGVHYVGDYVMMGGVNDLRNGR